MKPNVETRKLTKIMVVKNTMPVRKLRGSWFQIILILTIVLFFFLLCQKISKDDGTLFEDDFEFVEDIMQQFEDFSDTQTQIDISQNKQSSELTGIAEALETIGGFPDPDFFLKKWEGRQKCGKFPDLYSLEFSNTYWQTQRISNLTLFLFRAYYDARIPLTSGEVVILAMIEHKSNTTIKEEMYCQFWYESRNEPLLSLVILKDAIWPKTWTIIGKYTSYILTCPIPKEFWAEVPSSVSVVSHKCWAATNNLKVNVPSPNKKDGDDNDNDNRLSIGVCVKALNFLYDEDRKMSYRLIEWIELLQLLGAKKIFFYEYSVHPNIRKVWDYYVKNDIVEVTPITLPGAFPNDPVIRHLFLSQSSHKTDKRKTEVLHYNDCLYKNLGKFDYLAVLDTDEIIIPKNADDWSDLLFQLEDVFPENNTNNNSVTTYCFRNAYFFDKIPPEGEEVVKDVPEFLHMTKHIYRSANYTPPKKFVKCFHSVKETYKVHNHYPLACLNYPCKVLNVDPEIAHLQHYRSTCVNELKGECEKSYGKDLTADKSIWKWREKLESNVKEVLRNVFTNKENSI